MYMPREKHRSWRANLSHAARDIAHGRWLVEFTLAEGRSKTAQPPLWHNSCFAARRQRSGRSRIGTRLRTRQTPEVYCHAVTHSTQRCPQLSNSRSNLSARGDDPLTMEPTSASHSRRSAAPGEYLGNCDRPVISLRGPSWIDRFRLTDATCSFPRNSFSPRA